MLKKIIFKQKLGGKSVAADSITQQSSSAFFHQKTLQVEVQAKIFAKSISILLIFPRFIGFKCKKWNDSKENIATNLLENLKMQERQKNSDKCMIKASQSASVKEKFRIVRDLIFKRILLSIRM